MPDADLRGLGVTTADVSSVEDKVVKEAVANAEKAEAEELDTKLQHYDDQLSALRKDEQRLLRTTSQPTSKSSLQTIRKKIQNVADKRKRLVEAADARHSLKEAAATTDPEAVSAADASVPKEGETEREFLIRTGKLTPFQGQFGYERRQTRNAPVRRRRDIVARTPNPEDLKASVSAKFSNTATVQDPQDEFPVSDDFENGSEQSEDDSQRQSDDDFKPAQSDDADSDFELEKQSPHQTPKRRRTRSAIDEISGIADPEPSQDLVEGSRDISEREGDDWICEDEEEIEFEGGLRIPLSIYEKLFEYQKTAVKWLWEIHSQGTGAILADEMGLGKTVIIVAFLAALNYSEKLSGSVIVIAPATVLRQWKREFRSWWPRFRVRVLHHSEETARSNGTRKRRRSPEYSVRNVIDDVVGQKHGALITSYEQVRKYHELLLDKFEYVIADEGHKLKSPDAEITLVCKRFDTPRRIIVSGTPLQNHLKELWSLFDFVYPGKLGTLPVFHAQFVVPITMGGYSTASKAQVHTAFKCSVVLRDLITPYLLRRSKKDVATHLPEKHEQILFVKLTQEQREKYKSFLASRFVRQVLNGKLNLLYAITALRKICNHSDIPLHPNVEDKEEAKKYGKIGSAGSENLWDEEQDLSEDYGHWKRSGKMVVLDRVLQAWHKLGSRALIFSQTKTMLDILEKFVKEREYTYQRMDGTTAIGSRMQLIDRFNSDDNVFLFLLTTRVGGLGVNLTGADRVVLFDPDWNPSTDLQARERAWRVGQSRPVTVYRLITSGTIEEKVYHRQIYKQFLTNKVLSDPRQRRFFKPKDIKDLFTLADEEEAGTETGDIFAGTGVKEKTSGSRKSSYSSRDGTNLEKSSNDYVDDGSRAATQEEENNTLEKGNAKLLNALFDDPEAGTLHSTINHDTVLNAGTEGVDVAVMEFEADKVASKALEELRRSSAQRRRQGVAVPTWTGKSGLAGYVSSKSSGRAGASKASSLLQKIKKREGNANVTNAGDGLGLSSNAALMNDIIEFLRERGGESRSVDVIEHFSERVGSSPDAVQGFKSILKKVAFLRKGQGPGGSSVWKLSTRANNIGN